jgi:glycosyltransferase involved in cell wall biosynthesis
VRLLLDGAGSGLDDVAAQLRGSGVSIDVGWDTSTDFDYAIATVASSPAHVATVSAAHRGYLVQDFEAAFNPMSDGYIEAESSYTDGFDFLTVGSWLGHVLQTRYGAQAFSSGLGADDAVYRPLKPTRPGDRNPAVCFLYQPDKPRRTPKLGIEALRLVKRTLPETEILVYGSDDDIVADHRLDFEVENLGLIRDLEALNRLYNYCRVGLCISMTNPSRIPFELMAAGAVPVDVYRYNTLFDYDSGTALLAHQSPESLAGAMIELLTDDEGWQARQARCLDFIARRPLSWETDVMVNVVLARVSGIPISTMAAMPTYADEPVIAATDHSQATRAFCQWQRRSSQE